MYKIAAAATLMALSLGLATAEEFTAVISKVDGSKVTLTKYEKGQKGDESTLTATSDVKVTKTKGGFGGGFGKKKGGGGEGEAVEGGLKSDTFAKGNTVAAKVTTNDDGKITAISVTRVLKANEINAVIKKVDGSTITYVNAPIIGGGFRKKGDTEKKDETKLETMTVKATSSCKVVKGSFDKDTKKFEFVTLDDGLKNEIFSKDDVRAVITVNDDKKATEVKIQGGFGGNFKKGKKKTDTAN